MPKKLSGWLRLLAPVLVTLSQNACADRIKVVEDADIVKITVAEKPVLSCVRKANPFKPYVKELFTPSGLQVLLDSPPDHVHHHGLMYAINAANVEFWGEEGPVGSQVVVKEEPVAQSMRNGREEATIAQVLDWRNAEGKSLLMERRRITVRDMGETGPTLVTWESSFTPPEGAALAKIWGRHYFGMGMRFAPEMYESGRFFNASGQEGEEIRGTERVARADWCAFASKPGGKPVTVAVFDHPGNPRKPAAWFTMTQPFCYVSATLNLYKQRMILKSGETLNVAYGIALWDTEATQQQIADTRRAWIESAPAIKNLEVWESTHVNIAGPEFGTKVDASSIFGPDYAAAKAVDGRWAVRETDKWNSANGIIPHYLRFDLGVARTIDRVRIWHEGIMDDGDPSTTSDYRLQRSDKPWGPWIDVCDPVVGNAEPVAEHVFAPVKARYLRMLISTGEQKEATAFGRIYEIQIYSPKAAVETESAVK
ncbi:MAG TPA: PmoA family protein [Candidatus Brocadiia bacterium]|nr:PmoA family protein [Candidatus Brocadiia bacterium]